MRPEECDQCILEDCNRPLNRDGLCFYHKIRTLSYNVTNMERERTGRDVTGGRGTREYVRSMYAARRAKGLEDPEPANRKAAAFAPRKGILR